MINIHIVRDTDGFIWEFTVKGHAGAGRYGYDIVCSAVSVLAYTAVGALEEMIGIKNYIEKDGYMKCAIPCDLADDKKVKVRIILETIVTGFKQVRLSYKKYVTVLDEEV